MVEKMLFILCYVYELTILKSNFGKLLNLIWQNPLKNLKLLIFSAPWAG
jgi:hypothetical protein